MAYPDFPDRVYLDSNYLINLLSYPADPSNWRYKRCKDLYDHLRVNKTKLVASLFTLEETIHFLFFQQKLLAEAGNRNFRNIKEFKRRDRAGFKATYRIHSAIPGLILHWMTALGVVIEQPRFGNPRLNAALRVSKYAVKLLRKYTELDSKDAFHAATARVLRIETLISCDNDFAPVTEINHFNPC